MPDRNVQLVGVLAAVGHCYSVFGLHSRVGIRELRKLRDYDATLAATVFERPLRELSIADLKSHQDWSMGAAGLFVCLNTIERTKYLLPRVLEAIAAVATSEQSEDDRIADYEVTSKLIEYAWSGWPTAERASIRQWMTAVYAYLFTVPAATRRQNWTRTPTFWLDGVLACDPDVSPYLAMWWELAELADTVETAQAFSVAWSNGPSATGCFPQPLGAPKDVDWPATRQISNWYGERRIRDRWEAAFFDNQVAAADRQILSRAVECWDLWNSPQR